MPSRIGSGRKPSGSNGRRAELDAQSAVLAQRAGELESQQAVLVVQRAKLDRTRQDAERETAQLAAGPDPRG